jgi:aryl-alcohol dehydrogenase-like predicted oxidoreductase
MEPSTDALPRRRLGRLGHSVAALGLGGAWLGVIPGASPETQDEAAVEAVHRALALGMDYLDTSPLYGESERRVGLALSQRHPEGGRWRDRVRLVTKAGTHPSRRGDYSADAIRWSVENSLRLLRTDYLDAVLVHDPTDMAPVLAPGGAAEALVRLKEEGVIGGIGIGVAGHSLLRAAVEDGRFDIIQTTYDYSLVRATALESLVPLAYDRDLAVVNASPFHGGLLAAGSEAELDAMEHRRGWKSDPRDLERARLLHRWAAEEGVDLAALAVQFSLREARFAVTLVGPRTTDEVDSSIGAALAPIPEAPWARLAAFVSTLPDPSPGGEASSG